MAKYKLAAGVDVVQTRAEEVACAGGQRVLVLEGQATPVMALCRSFTRVDGATVEEAIAAATGVVEAGAERERLRNGLTSIVARMIESELLAPVERPTHAAFRSLAIATERGAPLVARLLEIAGYEVHEHRVAESHAGDLATSDPASLLVAWSLSARQLYALNDSALATRAPWAFVAALRHKLVVSPVIRPGRSACYACLRFRCLGAVQDAMAGGAIESAVIDGRPMVSGEEPLAVHEEFWAAGALIKALASPELEPPFVIIHRTGAADLVSVLRLPNCPVCSLL